jgi:hypothetical protein
MIPWIFLVFVVTSPFFISDFSCLGVFPPHFSQTFEGIVNLVYVFKEPVVSLILCVFFFLISTSLILALIFYYLSPSACFGFCLFLFF